MENESTSMTWFYGLDDHLDKSGISMGADDLDNPIQGLVTEQHCFVWKNVVE